MNIKQRLQVLEMALLREFPGMEWEILTAEYDRKIGVHFWNMGRKFSTRSMPIKTSIDAIIQKIREIISAIEEDRS